MLRSQRAESAPRLEPPPHLVGHVLSPAGGGQGGGIIAAAFDAMNGRRIRYAFRKGSELIDPLVPGCEIDIMIDPAELPAAEAAVATQGFRRLAAPGCPRHRFYLAFDRGRWLKIDAKIARRSARPAAAGSRWPAPQRFFSAVAQRRPLALRRQGPVVALLGPDGAGKGTIIEMLRERIPVALTVLYLGERRHPTREAHPDVDAEDRAAVIQLVSLGKDVQLVARCDQRHAFIDVAPVRDVLREPEAADCPREGRAASGRRS